jgi:glutamine synthetase adenylyltransferase
MKRTQFSPDEDSILTQLVQKYGEKNWKEISAKMNKTERQCRDRFFQNISPKLNKMNWTSDEDTLLLQKTEELGNNWVLISSFFNRTNVQCKDRARKLLKQQKKCAKLLKEAEILNQAISSSNVTNDEFFSFPEESDVWENIQWSF